MIHKERIRYINHREVRDGDYVLYWMQSAQRVEYNHALEYAIQRSNQLEKPLVVYFGLTADFPEANRRHYVFMLEGLKETCKSLEKRNIRMVVHLISPEKGVVKMGRKASLVVVDKDYLRMTRKWRREAAQKLQCPLIEVETNVIVPIHEASEKEEIAARTLRPKIKKKLAYYMTPVKKRRLKKGSLDLKLKYTDLNNPLKIVSQLPVDQGVREVKRYRGGASKARKFLKTFLDKRIQDYDRLSNNPNEAVLSEMSPYLHFGQISPLEIALKIKDKEDCDVEPYLEQLIVRRELAINYTYYNPEYDSFEGLNPWAQKTLLEHGADKRPYLYTLEELETAQTHDPYWNACQKEMIWTGKMHGYMRMYWGKKILEWTKSPSQAFQTALYLNNKYEIDGRDPNGFTGVAWCFGKHDHPWAERPVFGKIRYMNANGLRRKFNADAYAAKIEELGGKR